MRAFARDRLDNAPPMQVLESRGENTEVMPIKGGWRLVEHIPAKLEVTQLREPGPAPYRVYTVDDWDCDFEGSAGTPFNSYEDAERAARSIPPRHRAYVDNAQGQNVLKIVHHPATTHCPW
jgi:hypothetical protein